PDNTTNSDTPEEDNTSTDADNTDDSEEQTGDTSSTDQTTDQDPDNTTNSDTPEEDNTSTDADNTDDSEEQTGDTSSTDQTTDQDLDNTTNSGTPEEDGEEDTTPPKNSNQPSDNAEDTEETPIPERPSDEDNISTPPKPNRPLEPNKPKPLQQQDNTNQRTNAIHSQTSGSQHQQTTVNSNSFDENQNSNDIADSNISGTTTYGDLATNESNQNTEQDDSRLVNRFHQMSTGSFKYNPFILNQVKQLNNNVENVSDKDISSIIRRQNFSDNAFLNELQKGTNYFKFQYFNPLKSRDYYKNLDKQVLALITGEIGSMPDLKKPESENSASGKYEYHSSSDEEMTNTKDKKVEDAIDIKFERTLFALIVTITMIFIGVVVGYFVRRRNNENN
ncbi:SdrH family protein, partial [Staphylococcus aureus]